MAVKFKDPTVRTNGILNLHEAAVILEQVRRAWGMEWWTEAGTFLGMIREGDLIGHDSDIDFGVMGDEHLDKIKRGMELIGFEIAHEFGTPGRGKEISFRRYGIKVDVFCFYEDPCDCQGQEPERAGSHEVICASAALWMACWRDGRMIRLDFPKDAIMPTATGHLFGTPFRTPGSAEAYLTARYGEGWRTPDKAWRWDRSPRCINWRKSDWTLEELMEKYP